MHVLITRPKDDAEPLKSQIEQLGWRTSLEPLISVVAEPISPAALANAATLIVTSRNALRSLAASPALQHAVTLPLLTVGPGTASLAREMGFQRIFEGPGTGAGLVPEITRRATSRGEPFLYLSGDILAFDLPAALAEKKN
jgi:uroporphyrinogen-III synthase